MARAAWCVLLSRSPRRVPNLHRGRDFQGDRHRRRRSRHHLHFREPRVDALELKAGRGRLTDVQRVVHERLREAGANVAIAHGIDQALAQLTEWKLLRVSSPGADRDGKPSKRAAKPRRSQMDMSKYASSSFIKVDDLADGPEQKMITEIEEGQYEKPVVTFEDGTQAVAQRHQRSAR